MGIEIERKFLLANDDWRSLADKGALYRQGYLNLDPERIVRLRIIKDRGFLTIKGKTKGITRIEYEYEIPWQECVEMLEMLTLKSIIEKKRYIIEYKGFIWEIDEFSGENSGLIVAEVEIESEDQQIEKPGWIGPEVTDDPRYFNSNLINYPYKKWL
jgi:adenylate cyclase